MISDIERNDILITDFKEIADKFQDHFSSIFSDPNDPEKKSPTFIPSRIAHHMADIEITENKILTAILKIKDRSSAPDGDIPATILKNCKNSLVKPLMLLLVSHTRLDQYLNFIKSICQSPPQKR